MIKDGKYRYTLQFGMNTAEERQAGQFLEQLGNKKSPIIVAALNKYLEDNPGLLDSQVRVQVHVSGSDFRILEDKIRQLIEERLSSGVPPPASYTSSCQSPRECGTGQRRHLGNAERSGQLWIIKKSRSRVIPIPGFFDYLLFSSRNKETLAS